MQQDVIAAGLALQAKAAAKGFRKPEHNFSFACLPLCDDQVHLLARVLCLVSTWLCNRPSST